MNLIGKIKEYYKIREIKKLDDLCKWKKYNQNQCLKCKGYNQNCGIYISNSWMRRLDREIKENYK